MAYSNFKLDELVKIFDLTLQENSELFDTIPELESSEHLITTLQETVNLAVAINTEKARSEMIIAPVLLELRRKLKHQISLFSGIALQNRQHQTLTGENAGILSQPNVLRLVN